MAEIYELIGNRNPKVYNLASKSQEEAMKYLRYLHRNALFGTHTGLPPQIKNSKINESLVSNIGDYSVIDVYAKQLTKCMIGTVVNFILDDTVNPLGETYVYPCTDKNKPMGYMISDATPDALGVCLVHGVLEVPLYYFGEEGEKRNYVEYDLENACFKFADSGYPVFNVYRDVDGDWIAIILFGDVSSDYEYDGPFAVSVAGVTGSTMFVDVAEGDIVDNGYRYTCSGIAYDLEDLSSIYGLSTGETLWLGVFGSTLSNWTGSYNQSVSDDNTSIGAEEDLAVEVVGSTYSFLVTTGVPIDLTGNTAFYRIAENDGGELRQLQYGDVFTDNQEISAFVSGNTAKIHIEGNNSCVIIKGGTNVQITSEDNTENQTIVISATGGTISNGIGYPDYPYLASGGTVSVSGSTITGIGVTYLIPVPADTLIEYETSAPECIDVARFVTFLNSPTRVSHDLIVDTPWRTPSSSGGYVRISVLDNGMHKGECLRFFVGGVDWTNALPLYRYGEFSIGTASYSGSFYVTSYDTIDEEVVTHHYTITDTNDRAPSNLDYAGWVHIGNDSYHVDAISGTFVDGDSVYLIGTFASDNSVSLAFSQIHSPSVFPNINANQFCVRICYASGGVMHQTQYGDIVQPARYVGDGTTAQVIGNTISCIGGDGFVYTGPFAVSVSSYSGGTVRMTVAKGTVVIGNKRYNVPAQTQYISVAYGEYLCLNGYYEGEGYDPEFSYISVDDPDDYSISEDHFLIIIAQNVGGTSAKQIQFGEISTIPWGTGGGSQDINATVSGGTAFIGLTGSTNNVKLISDGSVDITGVTNNTIQLAVSGGTGGGSSGYSVLATGGTVSTRLVENNDYIVWVKFPQDALEEVTYAYLQSVPAYSNLDIDSDIDVGQMLLELPVLGASYSSYCFVTIDNNINPMGVTIIDTEEKGIAYGDYLQLSADEDGVYINDSNYKGNAFVIGMNAKYMLMYDPVGVSVYSDRNESDRNEKVHWFISRIY